MLVNGNNRQFNYNKVILLLILVSVSSIILSGGVSAASISNNQTNDFSQFNNCNNQYDISIFDPSIGGNVLNNTAITQNIPRTYLSNKIFHMTNQGSVILRFGNGNGPKVLICAGVHGNEPQANIALMQYVEFIKDKKFNGTLYIIPFAIPEDTALNTRYYNGSDPNRIANINGTPGWKIVQFAKDNGINYLIDVHSGGGVDANGFIYINSISSENEKNLVSYIVSKTKCSTGVEDTDDPGMIRYSAHQYGINSITLETERDNVPVMDAANVEYKMIQAGTQYLGFAIN
ncbi:succinylglutamate desuccinylase/aspartoacylase family protein [Methanobacterium sp.]|uniref:succinylglutamate desuccinylase/aspartoacylase family protein n=1 Tax=Methanobacterium sp. TaxID=2164 RepID=UPI003C735BC6